MANANTALRWTVARTIKVAPATILGSERTVRTQYASKCGRANIYRVVEPTRNACRPLITNNWAVEVDGRDVPARGLSLRDAKALAAKLAA